MYATIVNQATNALIVMPPLHRTNREIAAELESLEQCIEYVRPFSSFGDDNQAAIEAQVRVIREGMGIEQLLSEYEDGDMCILSAALDALDWLNRRIDSIVEGWFGLLLVA